MSEEILVNPHQFKFELVAPEKIEVASLEERVLLPGELGDFMVMAGHTQLLAGLRPGVVSILHANNTVTRYFITGGMADVGNAHCIVLTPHCTPIEKLSSVKLEEEIQKTETALTDATEQHEQEHLNEQLELLQLKLEAAVQYAA